MELIDDQSVYPESDADWLDESEIGEPKKSSTEHSSGDRWHKDLCFWGLIILTRRFRVCGLGFRKREEEKGREGKKEGGRDGGGKHPKKSYEIL